MNVPFDEQYVILLEYQYWNAFNIIIHELIQVPKAIFLFLILFPQTAWGK